MPSHAPLSGRSRLPSREARGLHYVPARLESVLNAALPPALLPEAL